MNLFLSFLGQNYSEESMIVNSNPSTPEHMKSTSILSGEQNSSGVDLNCNPLNHSQPQQLSLTHNHNYNYNQYFNNNININNNNHTNVNNTRNQSVANQTALMQYEIDANDLNPMDFIDNDIPTPDETLFNLDTFDILGDIDNLDDLSQSNSGPNGYRTANLNQMKSIKSEPSSSATGTSTTTLDYRDCAANITDYSPEWCYPEGMQRMDRKLLRLSHDLFTKTVCRTLIEIDFQIYFTF